jgi:hypothetical protein
MAQIRICGMSLKRAGDASYWLIELQDRATVPTLGDLIEVHLNKESVLARVVNVAPPSLERHGIHFSVSYIDLDEVVNFD